MCGCLKPHAVHATMLRELAADRAVIAVQGRAPLASALLKLATQPRTSDLTNLAISNLTVTDARIDQLLAPDHPLDLPQPGVGWWVMAPLALLIYVILCSVDMAFV